MGIPVSQTNDVGEGDGGNKEAGAGFAYPFLLPLQRH